MYLVAIAWLYVAVMMAVAEAVHSQGTVLGAIITFVMYGVLPLALVMYVMGTPMRRRRLLQEQASAQAAPTAQAAQEPPLSPLSALPATPSQPTQPTQHTSVQTATDALPSRHGD
jgi:heme exporter protein D